MNIVFSIKVCILFSKAKITKYIFSSHIILPHFLPHTVVFTGRRITLPPPPPKKKRKKKENKKDCVFNAHPRIRRPGDEEVEKSVDAKSVAFALTFP